MPEIWLPYGNVETLVTIQAENLGAVAEPSTDVGAPEIERMVELAKGSSSVFVCDSTPSTLEVLKGMAAGVGEEATIRYFAAAPKRVEAGVQELKGKITTLPPPLQGGTGDDPVFAPELMENGTKLFVGTARPDPLFGIVDSRVEACLSWVTRSRAAASKANAGMEPRPFQKTDAYETIERIVGKIPGAEFISAVPRAGRARAVLEDAPFDAIKNAFPKVSLAPARGMIVGAGGRGYDETFASALRTLWSSISGVRRSGSILLVAECGEGMGSTALELLVTGRMAGEGRRERYVDGIEEVFYLNKLKEDFDVLLLSGLPEAYARSKLGLTTAKGSGEAVGRILNKVGRSGKLNVIPRASECAIESG